MLANFHPRNTRSLSGAVNNSCTTQSCVGDPPGAAGSRRVVNPITASDARIAFITSSGATVNRLAVDHLTSEGDHQWKDVVFNPSVALVVPVPYENPQWFTDIVS